MSGAIRAGGTAPPTTAALLVYERLGRFPGPWLARRILDRRVKAGKEEPSRIEERFGFASRPRPEGELLWFHAASVGETVSLLPLLARLRRTRPDTALLLTTGTRTSAQIAADQAPAGVIHQFAPLDLPAAVEQFLDHWRPSLFALVESEIWPVMLTAARKRGVATALLSARLSERSAAGWARAPRSIAALLDRFDAMLSQTSDITDRLIALGADPARVSTPGSLKEAAGALPADEQEVASIAAHLSGRPFWIAASTHAGEEAAVVQAHQALASRIPGLLTLIAPRHPERAEDAMRAAQEAGLPVSRRSETPAPGAEDAVFVIDRLGELGLWYRLAPIVVMGGSLGLGATPIGGHNPLEPARLGCAVLFGPDMANFADERARLLNDGAALELGHIDELPAKLGALFDPEGGPSTDARLMSERARTATESGGEAVLERYELALSGLIGRRAPPGGAAASTEPGGAPSPAVNAPA